jgi:NAD(P)-dependent dehydrogenase (short-subunit alcohol dehydrogenase family)
VDLSSRTALVTGGGRGVGKGVATALAACGARVAITYRRDEEAAAATVKELKALGAEAVALPATMEDPTSLEEAVAAAREALGPIDLFVSNAGLASRGNAIFDTDAAEIERLLAAHALAAHRITRLLLADMRRAPRGDVIVISSSEVAHMRAGGAPYNMAKAALEAFALTLAKEEAANGIRVNIVAPGLVVTDMGRRLVQAKLGRETVEELDADQPFGRVVRPDDVGRLVAAVASAELELVTGQRIVIDGGADASPTGAD